VKCYNFNEYDFNEYKNSDEEIEESQKPDQLSLSQLASEVDRYAAIPTNEQSKDPSNFWKEEINIPRQRKSSSLLIVMSSIQGRQSIPKSEGDGLQIRKVRRYATRNFFKFWYTETTFPAF
jgi:hypothetical protein